MASAGYVYLLRHGNTQWYKIGRTVQSTAKRQRGLTTGNPEGLTEIQSWFCETRHGDFESHLHALFTPYHLTGRAATEFFDFTNVFSEEELVKRISDEHEKFVVDLIQLDNVSQSSSEFKSGTEQIELFLQERRQLQAAIKMAEIRMKTIDNLLKQYIGTAAGLQDVSGRPAVAWTSQHKTTIDIAGLRLAHPAIADAFCKKVQVRVFRML